MKEKEILTRSAIEVMNDVNDATLNLNALGDMLQMLIESTKLDQTDWTNNEEYEFVRCKDRFYTILDLVSRELWEMDKTISNIPIRIETPEAKETA